MASRHVKRISWAVVVCTLVVLGVKTFVGDVYRVSSTSMEPFLHKDEWVFTLHDSSPPERFEPVVVQHRGRALVKRAVGLGGRTGESLLIDESGDLRIDGARLPPAVRRPDPVVVFDSARQSVAQDFARGGNATDPWTELADGTLRLDARAVDRGTQVGMLRFHRYLRDGYLDADGNLVDGGSNVNDAVVEAEARVLEPGGRLRLALVEQGDTFSFVVDLSEPGLAQAQLVRESPPMPDGPVGPEVLAQALVELELGAWTRVRFANVDNHLTVEWGDDPTPVIDSSYQFNRPSPLADQQRGTGREGRVLFERVLVGGDGCLVEVRGIRILRDLHWVPHGAYGVGVEYPIEPGHVFLLGDNSADSIDSRAFGAVPEDQILGRPWFVVWPPRAIRGL